jgi:hypothetical protein
MADLLWLLLPAFAAEGSGILSYCVMQARLEVALANERQDLAESRAACDAQRKTMEDTVRAVEEEVRRKALDEFLGELRVEERCYTRERRMLFMNRKSLVLEERMYFRNIPLSSGWNMNCPSRKESTSSRWPVHSPSSAPACCRPVLRSC